MVRQPDIFPTIFDLIGIEDDASRDVDGRSFAPLIHGQPWEPAPAFLSVSGTPADLEIRGVRTETHKLTFGPHNEELPAELYDLRHDPGETRNVFAAHPDLCARLRSLADSFIPAEGQSPLAEMELSAADRQRVEKHLQELGYL